MPTNDDEITRLMLKYSKGEKLSEKETRILKEWWNSSPAHRGMEEKFGNKEWVEAELKKMQPAPVEEIWAIVNKHIQKQPARRPEEQKQIPPSRMPVYARWQVWVPAAVVLG